MSETAEVPVHKLPDGREFISDECCLKHPEVMSFVHRFNNYWMRDEERCGWVSP